MASGTMKASHDRMESNEHGYIWEEKKTEEKKKSVCEAKILRRKITFLNHE